MSNLCLHVDILFKQIASYNVAFFTYLHRSCISNYFDLVVSLTG